MRKLLPYTALFIISLPIIVQFVASASIPKTDLSNHYEQAFKMPDEIHVAHALYYFSVRIYDVILPNASPVSVNVFSMITFMSPLLLLLYALLKRSAKGQLRDSAIAGLAICLFLMAPIYFFADNRYMTGYVNSMVWHSPTYHALRLFIVPVSLLALRAVDGSAHRDRAERAFWTLLTAGLLSLATFAKPSYTIALLPGCCLFALCRVWIRQPVDWSMLLLGIVLPGAVMLGLQYLVNFGNGDDGIQFGVILSARFHVESTWQIPFRIILSLAFPLSVYLLYFSESRKHTYLNLSWLICMLGLFFMYFFNVTGWRSNHAVFNWTAYSAAFALMYASTQFLMEKYSAARRRPIQVTEAMRRPVSLRPILVATMFGLHVGCGIVYYFQFLSYPG